MSRNYYLSLILLCAPLCWAQVNVNGELQSFVPAGTLLHCTLDEPNFSSQTAQVGDPILCHLNSVEMFGLPVIPRGALLSGRMQEFRDPGHFFGKGWLQLEFTGLTLPTGNFPVTAKVISATRYKVDKEGKIKGKGHPTRDAIEWSIPILWPLKVVTLPARGPRPALKGETRLGLRLMEDVYLPSANSRGLGTRSSTWPNKTSWPTNDEKPARVFRSRTGNGWAETKNVSAPQPTASLIVERTQAPSFENSAQLSGVQRIPTVLALRSGSMFLVSDYWIESRSLNLCYVIAGGVQEAVPLRALDVAMTDRLNAQRGVPFVLTVRGEHLQE
jgi:hypothetical protein